MGRNILQLSFPLRAFAPLLLWSSVSSHLPLKVYLGEGRSQYQPFTNDKEDFEDEDDDDDDDGGGGDDDVDDDDDGGDDDVIADDDVIHVWLLTVMMIMMMMTMMSRMIMMMKKKLASVVSLTDATFYFHKSF